MTSTAHPETWGVATGYHDYAGNWREAPARTVAAILEAMGAGEHEPPAPRAVTVRTDHPLPSLGRGVVVTEDGVRRAVDGPLPPDLPTGYHTFEPDAAAPHPLIVSPGRVPVPAGRQWGFSCQLYATRSRWSWGIGDLADLRELGRWAKSLGAGFTLVNPLHAATPGERQQPSPYYPGSRCFLNPLYIAVEEAPGVPAGPDLETAIAAGRALNGTDRIDRDSVWSLKRGPLEAAFLRSRDDPGLARFRAERGSQLERFATYCAIAERHGPAWRDWPDDADRAADAERVRFHEWLQWVTESQLAAADAALGLVVDLAVGVDPTGPDSWIWRDCFADGLTVGAPPDEFNTMGQDWGLPPFDPWRLRAGGYEPWIAALRSGMTHGAGLRVDHVMGLFRLFWIPPGGDAGAGTYVRYPHHDLLNILALEAERADAFVVGEDLGTVEDEVRRDLAERRVLSYRLWWFEPERPPAWPESAMAAVTTHDLPTVAGVLTGSDLQAQRDIDVEPNEGAAAELLAKVRRVSGSDDPAEVVAAVYADLATSPCTLLVGTLDDALTVEDRPNMPGTTDAWPNWCLPLPVPLEQLEQSDLAARMAELLARGGGL